MKVTVLRQQGYDLLHQGSIALAEVEANGIRIDVPRLDGAMAGLAKSIRSLRVELEASSLWKVWRRRFGAKASLGSDDQLAVILYDVLGLPVTSLTEKGKPSVGEEVLVNLNHPDLPPLIRFSKYEKALGTFLKGIKREVVGDRLHPVFNLHTVRTYRSSSDSPNFQNFPVRDKELSEIVRRCFIASPKSVLVENDFKGVEVGVSACVTGDTPIQTLDGDQSIQTVISRIQKGEDVRVFAYSKEKGRIALCRATAGGRTRKKTEVWEVMLDNGETVKATPDHSFLLRSGEYRQLRDLQPGDSLMPLYRKKKASQWKTVYDWAYLNNGESEMVHNLAALDVHGVQIRGGAKVVHHKDGNGCNNSISNLQVMGRSAHMRIHSKQGWKNKGKGKRWTGWWDSSVAERMNAERRATWTERDWEEFGKKVSEGIARNGGRQGSKNPRYGKKMTEETKQRISAARKGQPSPLKGRPLSKEHRRRISQTKTGVPSGNKGIKLGPLSAERRAQISLQMTGRPVSPSHRRKLSRSKLEFWKKRKAEGTKTACLICGATFSLIGSHMRHKHPVVNHKVVWVRKVGREDVFNLNVEGAHNYAVGAGVIVKNCYHHDSNFISYITTPGKDMHRDMAAQIYCLKPKEVSKDARYGAKNKFVFPQFYGDYYLACAKSLWEWIDKGKLTSPDGSSLKAHLARKGFSELGACDPEQKPVKGTFEYHLKEVENDFWNKRFKEYGQWRKDWHAAYLDKGYFDLHSGFRIFGQFSRNQCTNFPVQGSAFHCLLWTLIQVNKALRRYKMRSKVVGQIHDSLIGDVREDELANYLSIVEEVVTVRLRKHYEWLVVPLEVEYEICPSGASWYQKKEAKFKQGRFAHPTLEGKWTSDAAKFLVALGEHKS